MPIVTMFSRRFLIGFLAGTFVFMGIVAGYALRGGRFTAQTFLPPTPTCAYGNITCPQSLQAECAGSQATPTCSTTGSALSCVENGTPVNAAVICCPGRSCPAITCNPAYGWSHVYDANGCEGCPVCNTSPQSSSSVSSHASSSQGFSSRSASASGGGSSAVASSSVGGSSPGASSAGGSGPDVCSPICGDGFVKTGLEQCDDGSKNGTAGDPCSSSCQLVCVPGSTCPNGAVCPQSGVCPTSGSSSSGSNGSNGSSGSSTSAFCGNSIVEGNEKCDLGPLNGVPNSGCTIACALIPGVLCPLTPGTSSAASTGGGTSVSSQNGTSSTGPGVASTPSSASSSSSSGLCVDSDANQTTSDIFIAGTVTANGKTYKDFCGVEGGDYVEEYSCNSTRPGYYAPTEFQCPGFETCSNGACIEPVCNDSDPGDDPMVFGTVTEGTHTVTDKCLAYGSVMSKVSCIPNPSYKINGAPIMVPGTKTVSCPMGSVFPMMCSRNVPVDTDGACVDAPSYQQLNSITCTNTQSNGFNSPFSVTSNFTGTSVTQSTSCVSDTILQYYECGPFNNILPLQTTCPAGHNCVNGACQP